MSTAETVRTELPTGTWRSDSVHSTVHFTVRHVISSFRGSLPGFDVTFNVGPDGATLSGVGQVASIVAADENLTAHLQTPDFFDAERYPELSFRSTAIRHEGDQLTIEGELTVRGVTRPIEAQGTIAGPVEAPWGGKRLGIDLAATFDRRDFGMDWNTPLPEGGLLLSNEVTLNAQLELAQS